MVAPNQQIGRYTLKRRLASGGMGEVYLADSVGAANFSKQVAIKCILPHLAQNIDFVQKFIDEANLMVQLHHGSIVPVIELFEENGLFYLVMEYVPGRDLKAVLRTLKSKKEYMPQGVALWVIKQLCEALGYAHGKHDSAGRPLGIIHRDVSPSNVILGASGEVKLLDFGIAKARSRVHQSISGTLQGKFVYMSPEVADGRSVDPRTDLFSLGLVLYELLTHTRPLDGESETAILRNARECEILPPSLERPELHSGLDGLVMKALAKNPDDRYENAFDFIRSINAYLGAQKLHPTSNDLTKFLHELFPDGVVDSSPNEIQSIDDALLQQINALTPSLHKASRQTVTQDGTQTLLPQPKLISDEARKGETGSSLDVINEPPAPATIKTRPSWLARLLVAICILSGVILLQSQLNQRDSAKQKPMRARVTKAETPSTDSELKSETSSSSDTINLPIISERRGAITFLITGPTLEETTLKVDDAIHRPSDELPLGRTYLVCANAPGYERTCQRIRLDRNGQALPIDLRRTPILTPVISGLSEIAIVTVNGIQETEFPLTLQKGLSYQVCVRGEKNLSTQQCLRLVADNTHHQPEFNFDGQKASVSKRISVAKIPSVTKAPPAAVRTISTSVIRSIPTAEVYIQNSRVGTTPFIAQRTQFGKTLQLKAKGYVDTTFKIPQRPKTSYRVNLNRPGYLTMRVTPPASQILVDDKIVGTGYLVKFPIEPGKRKIEARFSSPTGQLRGWGPNTVQIAAGQEKRLPKIILKTIGSGPK